MIKRLLIATAALSLTAAVSAHAGVIVLQDNFDSSTAQGNWSGDGVFESIPQPGNVNGLPSVDLVGPGFFDNLAYSTGNSVDLDGSTGSNNVPAGELLSLASLPVGDYVVSFLMAGNMRNSPDQTTAVSIGSQTIDVTPTSNTQPYTEYSLTFNNVSGQVAFTDLGPSNQQGDLLDNVVVQAVPEPATWALMLLGIGAIGGAMRVSRRKSVAAFVAS